jgi:hypothetical protein
MDPLAIANAVLAAIQVATKAAPIVIKGVEDGKVFAVTLWQSITGKPPTAEDEAAIDALIASLTADLEKPLPPAQPGDPDYVS